MVKDSDSDRSISLSVNRHRMHEKRATKRIYHKFKKPRIPLTCVVCKIEFLGVKNQKVCSYKCRYARMRERYLEKNPEVKRRNTSILKQLEREYEEFRKTKGKYEYSCSVCGERIEVRNKVCVPCRKLRASLTNSTKWYLEKGLVMVWLYGYWVMQPKWLARKNKGKGRKTYPTEF